MLERERTQVDKYAGGLSMGVGEGNQFNMQTGGIAVVHGSFGKVSPVSLGSLLPSLPHKKGIYFLKVGSFSLFSLTFYWTRVKRKINTNKQKYVKLYYQIQFERKGAAFTRN